MGKPFNLAVKEVREGIAKLFDESGLPVSMLASIIGESYNQLTMLENAAIAKEQKEYEESLKAEKTKSV
jgi:hypothetical protein